MSDVEKRIYLLSNLDDELSREIIQLDGVEVITVTSNRKAIEQFIKFPLLMKEIVELALVTILNKITNTVLLKEMCVKYFVDDKKGGIWFNKELYKPAKKLYQFFIDNLQIHEEEAKTVIEYRIRNVVFYNDYIEITTELNEEAIEYGFE